MRAGACVLLLCGYKGCTRALTSPPCPSPTSSRNCPSLYRPWEDPSATSAPLPGQPPDPERVIQTTTTAPASVAAMSVDRLAGARSTLAVCPWSSQDN